MKELKQNFLKSFEINIQYENELISIKSEPFKTLENILIKALKKMLNNPPNNIHCFYLGVDITKNKSKKIGDLFNHTKKVNLKLKPIENAIKSKTNENLFISTDKNKSYSLDKQNVTIFKRNYNNNDNKRLIKIKSLIIKNNKYPSIYSYYTKNSKIIFNPINKFENNSLIQNESQGFPVINKSFLNNSKEKDIKYLCKCKKLKISYYCRTCKMVLCNNCKNNEKHKNHLMIFINTDDIIKSIIEYGNNIQNEIINIINVHKTLLEKSEIISFEIFAREKKNIIEKYQKMIENYILISNKIDNYLKKENKEVMKLKVESYNELLKKLNKEINDLMQKTQNQQINFNSLKYIFYEISSKEDMISIFGQDILKYHLINDINTKLKSSIKVIEKTMEDLINKNNPFNLDSKYYDELVNMKIIELPKRVNNKNKEKTIIIGGHEISQAILTKRRKNIFSLYKEKEKEEKEGDDFY